ncbi:MAG: hypothetical protein ACXU7O_13555 [Croceibacterium sp.]
MGEYEPDDSRDVTLSPRQAPGEPPRTGPREDEARAMAKEQQGGADPESADKPTARDAHGNKQPGYATNDDEADEEPPLGK